MYPTAQPWCKHTWFKWFDSSQCWTGDTRALSWALLHSDPVPSQRTDWSVPHPGRGRNFTDCDKRAGQTALARRRAWPDQHTDQPTCNWPSLSPYASIFPCFFLPESPKSIPSPTLGSSREYPIISPVQSQNALPLHPLTCPTPLGNDPSPKDAPALTPPHGCHLWSLGLRVPWVSPGTVWTGWLILSAHP